jgi:predicted metal-binding protein
MGKGRSSAGRIENARFTQGKEPNCFGRVRHNVCFKDETFFCNTEAGRAWLSLFASTCYNGSTGGARILLSITVKGTFHSTERGAIMKRVAIFYCKRIKDHTCIACAKCFKGASEKNGEFARHGDDIEIVAMTDDGDCPGLLLPRVSMIMKTLEGLERGVDAIHLGTCMQLAREHGNCPLDLEEIKQKLEQKFNKPVYIGTHTYV